MDYYSTHNGSVIEYGMVVGGRVAVRCTQCYDTMIQGDTIYSDDSNNTYCTMDCHTKHYNNNNWIIDLDIIEVGEL